MEDKKEVDNIKKKKNTKKQIIVLEMLINKIPTSHIAKYFKCSRQAIHKTINILLNRRLIVKTELKPKKIYVTEEGRKELMLKNRLKRRQIRTCSTPYCEVCGYNLVVNKHHIDGNRKNNHFSNIISLCPNHHFLLHQGGAHIEKKENALLYSIEVNSSRRFFLQDGK